MDTRSETRGRETKHSEARKVSKQRLSGNKIYEISYEVQSIPHHRSSHLISSIGLLIPSHSFTTDHHTLKSPYPHITSWAPFSLFLFPALFLWCSFRTMPYYFSWVPSETQQWHRHISSIASLPILLPLRSPVSAVCKRRKKEGKERIEIVRGRERRTREEMRRERRRNE